MTWRVCFKTATVRRECRVAAADATDAKRKARAVLRRVEPAMFHSAVAVVSVTQVTTGLC